MSVDGCSGVFDGDAYNLHLTHVWSANRSTAFTMPWERTMTSPWQACKRMRTVFPDMVRTPLPPLPVRSEPEAKDEAVFEETAFKIAGLRAASNIDNRLWAEKLSWERKAAYKKWSAIILHEVGAWEITRLEIQCKSMEFARGGLLESIADALGSKATSTLHSRASPLLHYIKFYKDRGKNCVPLHEFQVYDFLKANEHRAASFPRSFLMSVNFADHHFGLHGAQSVRASCRIKGLVEILYAQRKKLVQRPPLTVKQIKHLERVLHDEGRAIFDRLASGYFLFLVYGRLRYSDGLQVTTMALDQQEDGSGFLECLAEKAKTSVTLEKKSRRIPIAVPLMFAIVHGEWIDCHACAFGSARKKLTTFLVSHATIYKPLQRFCPGDHQHEPWGYDALEGTFNTAKEAEYPDGMCQVFAEIVQSIAQQRNIVVHNFMEKSSATAPQVQKTWPSSATVGARIFADKNCVGKEHPFS